MKALSVAVCLLAAMVLAGPVVPAQAAEVLTNDSVVQMVNLGLSKDIILAKLKSEPNSFDTSAAALADLQHKGVPSEVITAMISGQSAADTPAAAAVQGDTVYYGSPPNLQALGQTHTNSDVSNRKRYIPIAGSFMPSETFVRIPGRSAPLSLDAGTRVFYSSIDPGRLRLLHFAVDSNDTRYVVFNKGRSDREVQVSGHRLSNGLYELDLSGTLEKGEQYAWLLAPAMGNAPNGLAALMAAASAGAGNGVAFDFAAQ